MSEKVRVDKWLWSVRIFKSRSQATQACKSGNVKYNDVKVKPSQPISVGDELVVSKNGFNFQYRVLQLIEKRVGAPIAEKCYVDITPEEELNKYKTWFIAKRPNEYREKGAGRPTKKERRQIDEFKDKF